MARPVSVHPDLVRAARRLARRKHGAAEIRRELIPLADRLRAARPSYSFLRELVAEERPEDRIARPSPLDSLVKERLPTLVELEEALVEKPRRKRLRS